MSFIDYRDLLQELDNAIAYAPDYRRVYNDYNKVLQLLLNHYTAHSNLNFSGTFAKTDYLLKEHGANRLFSKQVNDTRIRLRKTSDFTDDILQKCFIHDKNILHDFIEFLEGKSFEEHPDLQNITFPSQKRDVLRVIVSRWDEERVVCTTEQNTNEELTLSLIDGKRDWSYLTKMLFEGCQLNLVRPWEKDGITHAELIIFEPDYLVDISSVSRCFTPYAESPFVNIINLLQMHHNTEHTMLGNLASQLLDEEIHQQSVNHTYKDSVQTFWQQNAVGLLTTDIGADFHQEAMRQQANIKHAFQDILPSAISHFDSHKGIVEPSFYSEMLGLQGRMDYLQLDMKVLLEQKSGKGEFPYEGFKTPRHREEHYVQLLLYMALLRYNYQEQYEENNRELHAFLLYSKYAESLLGLGFAPELLFRAIKVRNGIACSAMMFAREGGFSFLTSLTPEKLNQKHFDGRLWQMYLRPQIEAVLEPIHSASDLERAYYLRFLQFIAQEHVLAKLGSRTKENTGFASIWHDTLEEKIQAGNIYCQLSLLSPSKDTEGPIESVRLSIPDSFADSSPNFRIGDIVILYCYKPDTTPDARKQMVFRASVEELSLSEVTLRLRAPQTDAKVFLQHDDWLWAIEHDFMESSFSGLYRSMHSFLSAPKERRDLLLLQREAETDNEQQLQGDYKGFNDLSLRIKQAKDLFIIIGPPGTGKTSFGMLNTLQEELCNPSSSVLLLSYTNRAVDEMCSKLDFGVDYLRIGSELNCLPEYKSHLLSQRARNCTNINELRQMVQQTRIVVATTTSMMSHSDLFLQKQFALAIIDEASQILEPHIMGLLSAQVDGQPAIRKFVMIGDHKQLPAVVQQSKEQSTVTGQLLLDIHLTDCRLSLFERLLRHYKDNPAVVYMLNRQGRMHPEVAQFPNKEFYEGKLDIVPLPHQLTDAPDRVRFIHVPTPQDSPSDKVNLAEAEVIANEVLRINDDDIGIIVPYRNQIAAIRNTLQKKGITTNITIDTVERYQGSQRKYIIYGFTMQKRYQLDFLCDNTFIDDNGNTIDRKLNVVMTRAKEHLILVGNAHLLKQVPLFRKLIENEKLHFA